MALIPLIKPIGERFIELDRIHSTNDLAQEQVAEGMARHGDVIFAWEQFAGRGQRGKSWLSEPGQNLAMSIVLENAKLPHATPFQMSAWIALSSIEVLTKITAGDTAIKWPNDLYWKRRKLGGMLIETGKKWTVAGIGININQTRFEDALTNPVSLRQITGKSFDPKTIAQELTEQLNHRLAQWGDQGFSPVFEAYRSVLFGKSDTFQIREQGEEKTIRVMDVTPEGLLRVEENGSERCLSSGIEWIILP